MTRGARATALLALAVAGFVVADGFAKEQVRLVQRLRPAAPRTVAVGASRLVDEATAVAASSPTQGVADAPTQSAQAPPPWCELDETSSSATGVGGSELRATAAWRICFEPREGAAETSEASAGEAKRLAASVEGTLAAEAPLGPAPWDAAAFQACSMTSGALRSAGRQFWPSASPEASAAWYARAFGARRGAATLAAVVERLASFEGRRAAAVGAALDRLVSAARARGDVRVAAYFAASGRVYLFDAGRFPELAELAKEALEGASSAQARAAEVCR